MSEPKLEQVLQRLDEIASELDRGELELDRALELYEEGVRLLRVADAALGAAQERMQRLRPDGEGHRLEPMEGE